MLGGGRPSHRFSRHRVSALLDLRDLHRPLRGRPGLKDAFRFTMAWFPDIWTYTGYTRVYSPVRGPRRSEGTLCCISGMHNFRQGAQANIGVGTETFSTPGFVLLALAATLEGESTVILHVVSHC